MTDLGKSPLRRALALTCAALVSTAALAAMPAERAVAAPQDDEAALRADADGPLRISREGGEATFVGTPAGTDIDNPSVDRRTSVSVAARSHLDRYGAAVGADRRGTHLVEESRRGGSASSSVVRYRQQVDGVPVLGGDVVMTLDAGRDLASVDANLSETTSVGPASVSEASARAIALRAVGRQRTGGLAAEPLGRWLLDPATVPVDGLTAPRAAWRFEVRGGSDVRRMVLVDDRAGSILLDIDLIQAADRVVCDQRSARVEDPPACTTGPARTESSGASTVADVNHAFANTGLVSTFYETFGTPEMRDLTELIGFGPAGSRKLASTVRVCITDLPCPYDNAYWNGQAMFYGAGYPRANDIVGHEMTHGVIERTSGLLYWDQSGAINESLADIIGEIVDHRHGTDDDSDFLAGESIGAVRSMKVPSDYGQPGRVTSSAWYSGPDDNGGVHTNSGVGNKAFYLISQGGAYNGQTVAGIDAGDPGLAKSAKLWVQVIATLSEFAEYDDLALVLDQACATLQAAGDLTAADCAAVDQVVLATEMLERPSAEPVRDAARTCPGGTSRRVLFESESGEGQSSAFTAPNGGWRRSPDPLVPQNAYSGDTAWFGESGETLIENVFGHRPLAAADWLALPAGQRSYLAFRHWHVFEYAVDYDDGSLIHWDGGTVELQREGLATARLDTRPWIHGPTRTLERGLSAPKAFAGSSKGWRGSRVDLSDFAGQPVKPQFTMHFDEAGTAPGWYLDDIEVYTCDPLADAQPALSSGTTRVGTRKSVSGPTWKDPATETSYQWQRNGAPVADGSGTSYTPTPADLGKKLTLIVTGTAPSGPQPAPYVLSAGTVQPGAIRAPSRVLAVGTPYVGRRLTASRGSWSPSGIAFTYRWLRDGRVISGAAGASYLLRSADKGHRIAVRITGSRKGYASRTVTSASRTVSR